MHELHAQHALPLGQQEPLLIKARQHLVHFPLADADRNRGIRGNYPPQPRIVNLHLLQEGTAALHQLEHALHVDDVQVVVAQPSGSGVGIQRGHHAVLQQVLQLPHDQAHVGLQLVLYKGEIVPGGRDDLLAHGAHAPVIQHRVPHLQRDGQHEKRRQQPRVDRIYPLKAPDHSRHISLTFVTAQCAKRSDTGIIP